MEYKKSEGEYFICPHCGKALCQKKELYKFKSNYCKYCGHELISAKKKEVADYLGTIKHVYQKIEL